MGGISFVHNSLFHTNPYDEAQMHARFGLGMKNSNEKGYDPKISLVPKVSQLSDQIIVRGHSHAASIYQVKRNLIQSVPDGVYEQNKPRGGAISTKGDKWEVNLDPDFKYVLVSASACGANTMFTPDNKLDYRPAGLIVEYDPCKQSGKATFFTVVEGYDHQKFIDSVNHNALWKQEVFTEAKRQIEHLRAGTLLGNY